MSSDAGIFAFDRMAQRGQGGAADRNESFNCIRPNPLLLFRKSD
jgi:hypothetical protein